jgi:putative membrane protein
VKILLKWFVCFLVLLLAHEFFPTYITAQNGAITIIAAATILWLFNIFIRPIAQLLALPFTLISFGICSLVVNALIIMLTDAVMPGFHIYGFGVCLLIALAVSFLNTILTPKIPRSY